MAFEFRQAGGGVRAPDRAGFRRGRTIRFLLPPFRFSEEDRYPVQYRDALSARLTRCFRRSPGRTVGLRAHPAPTRSRPAAAVPRRARGRCRRAARCAAPGCTLSSGLEGQEDKAVEVEVFLPDELKHFQLATGLMAKSLVKGRYTLKADNYAQLIDSPELAEQTRFSL